MTNTILLIEDNPDNSLLFSYLLTHEGFEVIECDTAEKALSLCFKISHSI